MKDRVSTASSIVVALTLITVIFASCQPKDSYDGTPISPGKGIISGIVTDAESNLPKGTKPQTYSGVSIQIYQANPTGGFSKQCSTCPEQPTYDQGQKVAEVVSGEGGRWQVELDAGKYYIKAFSGEKSYAENPGIVEVKKGEVTKLNIHLLHGV